MIWIGCILGLGWWNGITHPDWQRWEAMDDKFTSHFEEFSERPIELEVEAERLLEEAMALGDCDLVLIAKSLGFRAKMMLQHPQHLEDWQLDLPPGCSSGYPRIEYDIANLMLQAGEAELAESRLLTIVDAPKWGSHAWNLIGMIRLNQENLNGAMAAYLNAQEALSDIPNPSIYMSLGQISARLNSWTDALYWFDLAAEAQIWNTHLQAYSFVSDIQPILDANRLRAAINAQDEVAADHAWRQLWPTEWTDRPLLQIRTMLDYLFWRDRTDLIPGVVRMYEDWVVTDSAKAEAVLNDRVLLFEPWRASTGWDLERVIEILATAERSPDLRMTVKNNPVSEARPVITYARVMWLRRAMWLIVLTMMGWGILEGARVAKRFRVRRRFESKGNQQLLDELSGKNSEKWGADERWVAVSVLASRLQSDVENEIPAHLVKRLSAREIQMLKWILSGQPTHVIARNLDVSIQYVYNMRSALRRKLDLKPGEGWQALQTKNT